MSQGLFTAVSGITACQSKLDVISDNIANMNTVGFKSSQLNFENVFSRTLSAGSAPSGGTGGANPIQLGLGVAVGEIGRNFTNGTVQTTGRSTDLNIQGQGFFTLQNTDGSIILTRAGNFSTDANGNLVNPKGLKVIGTDTTSSSSSGTTPARVPQSLKLIKTSDPIAGTDNINNIDLNNGKITSGIFTLNINGSPKTITIDSNSTVQSVIDDINNLDAAPLSSGTISASLDSTTGKISIATKPSDATATPAVVGVDTFSMGGASDTSNFLNITGLNAAVGDTIGSTTTYTCSELINNKVSIGPADTTTSTYTISSFSIGKDGAIEATYANGDKISVTGEPNREFLYKTSTGIRISSDNINTIGNALKPAELQIQLANVINPNGLVSEGGNMFSLGPNAGQPSFGSGGFTGLGSLQSGGLESSNVNMTSEFSDMILAQRGIDANSRTFGAQNTIMQTIVNLGRG